MAEKLLEKVERLANDLAQSVQAEIEMYHYVKTLKAEKEKIENWFLVYAKDHGLANNLEEALMFLKDYAETKEKTVDTQLSLDI